MDETTAFEEAASRDNQSFTLSTLRLLSPDPVWTTPIVESLEAGRVETRSVVSWLADRIQPDVYAEVGVRRGFSLAMVAARRPEAHLIGFDLWVRDYAGVSNPGPHFVRSELAKTGFRGRVDLVSGDSHVTLPAFFGHPHGSRFRTWRYRRTYGPPPATLDLAHVDGDHSLLGAHQDLADIFPLIRVGGAVVFDDIAPDTTKVDPAGMKAELGADPHGWQDLLGLWKAVEAEHPGFRFFSFARDHPGVGFAVRLR